MAGYGTNEEFTAYAEAAGYVFPDGTTDAQISAARQRGSLVIDRFIASPKACHGEWRIRSA